MGASVGFAGLSVFYIEMNTCAVVSDNAAEIRGKCWGIGVSLLPTSALCCAETGEIMSVFFRSFGKTCCVKMSVLMSVQGLMA